KMAAGAHLGIMLGTQLDQRRIIQRRRLDVGSTAFDGVLAQEADGLPRDAPVGHIRAHLVSTGERDHEIRNDRDDDPENQRADESHESLRRSASWPNARCYS